MAADSHTTNETPRTDHAEAVIEERFGVMYVAPAVEALIRLARQLERELAEAKADAAAVRELMNVYNLGGWTDTVGPMKRALKAEAALETLGDELERIRAKLVLAADDEIMRQESAASETRRMEVEVWNRAIDAAIKVCDDEYARWEQATHCEAEMNAADRCEAGIRALRRTESATTQEMRHAGKPASHAPASSADLVLVPRNPTVEMLTAGAKAADLHSHSPRGIWAAMLAAAGNHERQERHEN